MRKSRLFSRTGLVSLLAAALTALGVSSPALALDNSGGIGGGAGGGTVSYAYWAAATGSNAFQVFQSKAAQGRDFESKLRASGADINICKRSNVIWWVHTKNQGGFWVNNWNGYTHGPHNSVSYTINSPWTFSGRPPTGAEYNQFRAWDRNKNGNKVDSRPGYTVICGGAFLQPDQHRSHVEWDHKSQGEKASVSGTYAYVTSVTPVKVEGQYPGGGDYESQSASVKTNFGKWYDTLGKDVGKMTVAQAQAKANELTRQDQGNAQSAVTLSAKNQAAFAKGGILNVSEHKVTAKIDFQRTRTDTMKRTCSEKRTWNSYWGTWNPWQPNGCTKWEKAGTSWTPTAVAKATQTPQNVGFYQMLSVHCNKEAFDALISGTTAQVVSQGDPEHGISAVAQTQRYDKQPTHPDFGDKSNPNAAAAATGTYGFYDKECPYDCTPSADPSQGASKANDAINNHGTSGATSIGLNGASADNGKTETNSFEFFRDNNPRGIRLDTWYPRSNDTVRYNGHAALTTTVSRWVEGTPDITGANGGKFTLTAKGNSNQKVNVFNGKGAQAVTQRNWSKGTFSNSTGSVIDGFYNQFDANASWASEEGKPQVLNFKWEYAPDVVTKFPVTLGFNRAGGTSTPHTTDMVDKVTPIEGKCYASFGTDQARDTRTLFRDNTGTGTKNTIDGTIIDGTENPSWVATNIVINFVRSTTE